MTSLGPFEFFLANFFTERLVHVFYNIFLLHLAGRIFIRHVGNEIEVFLTESQRE